MKIILGLCLVTLVCSPGAYSQAVSGYGAVTGIVRDPYGDGLPDTAVTLTNAMLGIRRTQTTTDDGIFSVPDLPPGSGYTLNLTHRGFSVFELKDVRIVIGATQNYQIVLPVLPVDAKVQPAPSYTPTDSVKFDVASTFPMEQIETLPTGDRRLESLVALTPFVTEDSSGVIAFRGEGLTNAFYADGVLASGLYFYRWPGIVPYITQDAVSEMNVISAAASAEFGHSANGFINVATHIGTDAYHGSAYGYYNNQNFNSRGRFDPAGFTPTDKTEHYGLNAGGPGLSRMFWFVNAEVTQGSSNSINLIANPMIGNSAGTAVDPANCGSAATAAQCAAAIAFINTQANRNVGSSLRSDNAFAKMDYRLNQSNSFTAEGAAMHAHAPNGSVNQQVSANNELLGNNGTYTDETRFGRASYTATPSSNTTNEIRAAWYHDRFSDYDNPTLLPSTGAVGITIAGTPVGGNPNYPMVVSEDRWQFADHLVAAVGNHMLTFGGEYYRMYDKVAQIYARAGSFDFASLTTFAEDFSANTLQHRDYMDFNQGLGQPVVGFKPQQIGAYAQDVWRPLPRLTVVAGVHWEKMLFPAPAYTSGSFYETGSIPSTSTDFSPRAGIAYQVLHHTVLRLGFGSYFQPYSGELLKALYTGNGINQASLTLLPNQTGNLVFPKIYANNLVSTSFPSGAQDINFPLNKFKNPYTEQATFNIEHSFSRDFIVSVGVMQTRGVRLFSQIDENLLNWSYTKVYTIDNSAGQPTGNYYFASMWTGKAAGTNFQHVYQLDDYAASRYNAAVAQVRKSMSHGISAQGSFVWSHAIDNVSGPPVVGGNSIVSDMIPGDYRDDQGNSSFDQRYHGVLNLTWMPTAGKSDPVSRFVLNGWQISAIANLANGLPETPTVIVNGQQFNTGVNNATNSITMQYVNSLNGSGGWNRVPFEDVNSLRNSSQHVVDARVAKVLPFTDRFKGIVMFEAFNLLNNQYSTSLDTIAYTATLGVLRPVPSVGTPIAADGFPYGTNARRAQVALRFVF